MLSACRRKAQSVASVHDWPSERVPATPHVRAPPLRMQAWPEGQPHCGGTSRQGDSVQEELEVQPVEVQRCPLGQSASLGTAVQPLAVQVSVVHATPSLQRELTGV